MTGEVAGELRTHLLRGDRQEDVTLASYRPSTGADRRTALLREVELPRSGERDVHGNASFTGSYVLRGAATAAKDQAGVVIIHSHPSARGWQGMSGPDEDAERSYAYLAHEVTGLPLVGMTLAGGDGRWSARVWAPDGVASPAESVRVVGDTLAVSWNDALRPAPRTGASQVRTVSAWGPRAQAGIARLHILVVGAQGDTREVGLDQMVRDGLDIQGAVKSAKWPTRAVNLEYSIVWATRRRPASGVRAVADGTPVAGVTASLDPTGRVEGTPARLVANRGMAFIGSYVLGMGFTVPEAEVRALIERDPRNTEVLFPYLNGEDLNSRPDCSPSRWVVNFFDWPEERAREYHDCWTIVEERVRSQRQRDNRARYRSLWWQYAELRPGLIRAITNLDRVLAITRVSKVVLPVFVPTGQVFSEATVIFASDNTAMLALLSSAPHYWWAIKRSSTLETRIRYTPSDVFETSPLPGLTTAMRFAGDRLDRERRALMLDRSLGLTAAYNLVHDPRLRDADIENLRQIHVAIDQAVCDAYGWSDLVLDHGHHETRQGTRWTIPPALQQEILDRLLELNHERHADEQRVAGGARRQRRGQRKAPATAPDTQRQLFAEEVM